MAARKTKEAPTLGLTIRKTDAPAKLTNKSRSETPFDAVWEDMLKPLANTGQWSEVNVTGWESATNRKGEEVPGWQVAERQLRSTIGYFSNDELGVVVRAYQEDDGTVWLKFLIRDAVKRPRKLVVEHPEA